MQTKKIGIGWCYTGDGDDHSWGDPYDVDGDANTSDGDACVAHQLTNFCSKVELDITSPLDPSNTLLSDEDQEYFYIPAMLVEAGLDSLLLGDGDTPLKTMVNRRKANQSTRGQSCRRSNLQSEARAVGDQSPRQRL